MVRDRAKFLARMRESAKLDRGISEFGEAMAALVEGTPGALGAVLSDAQGEPIDWARLTDRVDDLELQIFGAQLGVTMERVERGTERFTMGRPSVLIEAGDCSLLSCPVGTEYLLTVILDRRANLARALESFHGLCRDMDGML